MAQRRFNQRLVSGIVVGYVGMLFILVSILTQSWFIFGKVVRNDTVVYGGKAEGLFLDDSSAAKVCQAFACLSFIVNTIACIFGMAASFAVTRPRIAGSAVTRLKIQPKSLSSAPKIAGSMYVTSGVFMMISVAVACEHFLIGYSVLLAWISVVLCLVAGLLLFIAQPPDLLNATASDSTEEARGEPREADFLEAKNRKRQDIPDEDLSEKNYNAESP